MGTPRAGVFMGGFRSPAPSARETLKQREVWRNCKARDEHSELTSSTRRSSRSVRHPTTTAPTLPTALTATTPSSRRRPCGFSSQHRHTLTLPLRSSPRRTTRFCSRRIGRSTTSSRRSRWRSARSGGSCRAAGRPRRAARAERAAQRRRAALRERDSRPQARARSAVEAEAAATAEALRRRATNRAGPQRAAEQPNQPSALPWPSCRRLPHARPRLARRCDALVAEKHALERERAALLGRVSAAEHAAHAASEVAAATSASSSSEGARPPATIGSPLGRVSSPRSPLPALAEESSRPRSPSPMLVSAATAAARDSLSYPGPIRLSEEEVKL